MFSKYLFNTTRVWKKSLKLNGFTILKDFKPLEENYKMLACCLDKDIKAIEDIKNIADVESHQEYSPRTYQNYLEKNPKYLIYSSISQAKSGGEIILLDSHKINFMCKTYYYDTYQFLLEKEYKFESKDNEQTNKHKIIGNIVHYNPDEIYTDYCVEYPYYDALCQHPLLRLDYLLEPNELLIVDNHRILSGRNPYTGELLINCCFLD